MWPAACHSCSALQPNSSPSSPAWQQGGARHHRNLPTLSCLALLPLFLAAFICFSYLSAALFTCRQGRQALGTHMCFDHLLLLNTLHTGVAFCMLFLLLTVYQALFKPAMPSFRHGVFKCPLRLQMQHAAGQHQHLIQRPVSTPSVHGLQVASSCFWPIST